MLQLQIQKYLWHSSKSYKLNYFTSIIFYMLPIDFLVYTVLTVFVPLKLTFTALKQPQSANKPNWSYYWAIYLVTQLLQSFVPLLSLQPMKLGLLLFHLWLYSEDYQGAILFFTLAKKKIDALGLQRYIKVLAQHLKVLNVFELQSSIKEQKVSKQAKKLL